MSNSGRVTLKMIAEATGYTTNTVSHALKGKNDISANTTAYIQKTAKEMGYINDRAASSLRSGYSNSVALILPNIANPFWAILTKEINSELRKFNYTSLILDTNENISLEYKSVQSAISQKVDGIIICPNQMDLSSLELIQKNNIPYVLLGRHFSDNSMNYVVWDDENGGYLATSHLIEMGKKRILFINGPKHISSSVDRLNGYRRALEEHNIIYDPALVTETSISAASDNDELKKIFLRDTEFDAIFAFSDFIAWEVMGILAETSINSRQIPIVGFDDIQSNLRVPISLTTVGADKKYEAQQVVEILMDLIHKKNNAVPAPQQIKVPTYLVFH